jgi:hypothetical protein
MDKDNIKEYFEKYIETYPAYKSDKLYSGLMNYLVDFYYDDVYNKLPIELKTLYENQELQSNIYDKFLIAIGVTKQVINKLNYKEKIVFLKSLNDFRRYKGTIDFIRKIGKSFDDTFNVYELYIDYDQVSLDWIFRPLIIYKDTDLKEVREKIPYQQVYDSLPNFIVPKEQLESLRLNNQITLPIKSNILLLDEQIVTDISLLRNLIISTFIKDYKDDYITIYFSDIQYSLNIKTIYYAWYYLACNYYGTPWLSIPSTSFMLQFNNFSNPFSVYDLKDLLSEYEELETNKDIDLFYKNNLEIFSQYVQSESLTVNDMGDRLNNLDNSFGDYINQRINDSIDRNKEINSIINELYTSLIYYRDTYGTGINISASDPFIEFFDYFLESLPQLTIDPKDTTSYTLIYNFKPYHTELISNISNVLTYQDKFSSVMPSDSYWFHFEMIKYELLSLIDERYINLEVYKQSDIKLVSGYETIDMRLNLSDNLEEQLGDVLRDMLFLEYVASYMESNIGLRLEISDFKEKVDMVKHAGSNLDFNSIIKILDSINRDELLNIDVSYMINVMQSFLSELTLSDKFETDPVKNMVGSYRIVSAISKNLIYMGNIDNTLPEEQPNLIVQLSTQGDIFNLDEQFDVLIENP